MNSGGWGRLPTLTAGKLGFARLGMLGLGYGLFALLGEALDPPPTFSCTGDPPPEVRAERDDYLPAAIGVSVAFGALFVAAAWRWGRERGPVSRRWDVAWKAGAALLSGLWVLLIVAALGEETGGSVLYGSLLALAGLGFLGLTLVLFLAQLVLVKSSSPRWAERVETLTVWAARAVALSAYPATVVWLLVAGSDTTIWC